jgi:protein-S-isoprenylcysteine O-methyltransferase Ste14
MLFYVGAGVLVVLGLYVLLETKRTYEKGKTFSLRLSVGWWIIDTFHGLLVTLSSLYGVWLMPINQMVALIRGSVLLGVGVLTMLIGMIQFRSLRKISGLETSELVTTGIYQWSRNPQFFGWFLGLLGVSLIGRSVFAFLLTIVAIVFCHYYITRIEEPYLERVFKKKYLSYKSRVPRYIGVPKKRKGKSDIA